MKKILLVVALILLLAQRSSADTVMTCAQQPNFGCVAGDTYSGTQDFSGATLNLPANAVDAITEIAAALKSGSDTTLITGTKGTSGDCTQWDANGDLVTTGTPCGSGTGDIEAVFNCASGDCGSITIAATDLLDMSGSDASTTSEGLIFPRHATACAGGTADGQVCWESDANILHIGDGAALQDFLPASAFSADATVSGTGTVAIQANAVQGTDISLASEATGDLMYFNGTDWVRRAIGSTGTVLKVSGGVPQWLYPLVWNENICLNADCLGVDNPCDCCTGAGAGCGASTFTLAGTPRNDCDAFGAAGSMSAWSRGVSLKCVTGTPGINEFALATNVITPNAANSVMFITYEQ